MIVSQNNTPGSAVAQALWMMFFHKSRALIVLVYWGVSESTGKRNS